MHKNPDIYFSVFYNDQLIHIATASEIAKKYRTNRGYVFHCYRQNKLFLNKYKLTKVNENG